jgi:hypothetical protein
MKNIKWLGLLLILTLAACGGGSATTSDDDETDTTDTTDTTAPTVSSVTTDNSGADTALAATAGDTRVSGAANATEFFTITFDEAMDPATVIADNITLTCNDAAITIGTPATSDNIIWTVPVESNLTGYAACTLTLGVGLTDAAGNALAAAAAYAFNALCSTDDSFSIDTLGFADASDTAGNCWEYAVTGNPLPSVSSTSFAVSVSNGELQFVSPTGSDNKGKLHYLYKTFGVSSFTATAEIVGISIGGNLDCSLTAQDSTSGTQNASVTMTAGTNCALAVNDSSGPTSVCSVEGSTPGSPLYIQLAWDGISVTGKFGSSLSSLTSLTTPGSSTTNLGTSYKVGVKCAADAENKTIRISSFTIDATASGPGTQY